MSATVTCLLWAVMIMWLELGPLEPLETPQYQSAGPACPHIKHKSLTIAIKTILASGSKSVFGKI